MPDDAVQESLGNVELVEIQEEMERSFLDYAMSVITARGAAGRPRRSQARAPADPLRDVRHRAAARPQAPEVGPGRRQGHGDVPPPRRLGDLRRHGSDGPGLLTAVPARRRARELRISRPQRPPGCRPLHRGPPRPARHGAHRRDRRGDRRLRRDLRRAGSGADRPAGAVPEPARQRRRRNRRRHGDEHPAAQPGRGHRRGDPRVGEPRRDGRGSDEDREGSRLPDRGADPRQRGHQGRVHDRSRFHQDAAPSRRSRKANAANSGSS